MAAQLPNFQSGDVNSNPINGIPVSEGEDSCCFPLHWLPCVLIDRPLLLQKPRKCIIIGAAPISGDLLLELMIGQIVFLLQLQPGFSASDRLAGSPPNILRIFTSTRAPAFTSKWESDKKLKPTLPHDEASSCPTFSKCVVWRYWKKGSSPERAIG